MTVFTQSMWQQLPRKRQIFEGEITSAFAISFLLICEQCKKLVGQKCAALGQFEAISSTLTNQLILIDQTAVCLTVVQIAGQDFSRRSNVLKPFAGYLDKRFELSQSVWEHDHEIVLDIEFLKLTQTPNRMKISHAVSTNVKHLQVSQPVQAVRQLGQSVVLEAAVAERACTVSENVLFQMSQQVEVQVKHHKRRRQISYIGQIALHQHELLEPRIKSQWGHGSAEPTFFGVFVMCPEILLVMDQLVRVFS